MKFPPGNRKELRNNSRSLDSIIAASLQNPKGSRMRMINLVSQAGSRTSKIGRNNWAKPQKKPEGKGGDIKPHMKYSL
jgi:hypothetical protein